MKKLTIKNIAVTAILLAISIVAQLLKNTSVYLTGPVVNACLIISLISSGLLPAIILSIILPITSFLITNSPIISAIPIITLFIILGNIVFVLTIYFLKNKFKKEIISYIIGSIIKAIFMGITISLIILPLSIPENMISKLAIFQSTFSIVQLITALIGSIYAVAINKAIKK